MSYFFLPSEPRGAAPRSARVRSARTAAAIAMRRKQFWFLFRGGISQPAIFSFTFTVLVLYILMLEKRFPRLASYTVDLENNKYNKSQILYGTILMKYRCGSSWYRHIGYIYGWKYQHWSVFFTSGFCTRLWWKVWLRLLFPTLQSRTMIPTLSGGLPACKF